MRPADHFARAADYDTHAAIQREVAGALATTIDTLPLPPGEGLEIGCGTGFLTAQLPAQLGWTITDIAPAMLERACAKRPGATFHAMDGEHPDLAGPFALIASSLAFQWFADIAAAQTRLRSLLAPGGWLAFTTLAEGSFAEWRAAHADLPCGLHDYPDAAALAATGAQVSLRSIRHDFGSARGLLRHLKGIGAGAPRAGHRPLGPAALREVMARFDAAGAKASYVVATCLWQRASAD